MDDVEGSDARVAALVAAANRLGDQPAEPDSDDGRRKGLLILLGLIAAAAVGVVAVIAVTGGDDTGTIASDGTPSTLADDEATTDPAAEEEATAAANTADRSDAGGEPDAQPEPEPELNADNDTGAEPAEAGTESGDDSAADPSDSADTDAANDVTEATDESGASEAGAGESDVAESRAVVRGGQIVLEGAVPDQASSDRIEELAIEVLGEANVINNYFIDPQASDPNLGNITVEDTINFEPGSARILADGEPLLMQGLALLTIRPAVTLVVVGHTDDVGPDDYNLKLSQERADAVKQWFVDREVDPARITTQGLGEREPIADNTTPEGRRLNRRIVFLLENLLVDG